MTKQDYLKTLKTELESNRIADAEDILSEYEQHFIFKLADGYTEEEISAKLGEPKAVAAQFERIKDGKQGKKSGKAVKVILLTLAGIMEVMGYILFFGFVLVLAAAALSFAALGVSLICRLHMFGLIPAMPYACALIFGICSLALAVLAAAAACYCTACGRQMIRASLRWHKNVLSGGMLPPLPCVPQFSAKTRRRLRRVVNCALIVFGAAFVLGFILCWILSGSIEFWHIWGWFEG